MALMKMGAISLFVAVVVALAIGGSAGAAYATSTLPNTAEVRATLLVGLIGGSIAIVAAIISIWGVYSQRVLMRRQATIAHIAHLEGDRSVHETIQTFIQLSRAPGNLAQYADEDRQGSDETLAIGGILNQYELISIGIQRGIFEYELVNQWQASSIKRFWNAAHPFVVALRTRVGAPTIWKDFELLNKWVSGVEKPRKTLWWTGFG